MTEFIDLPDEIIVYEILQYFDTSTVEDVRTTLNLLSTCTRLHKIINIFDTISFPTDVDWIAVDKYKSTKIYANNDSSSTDDDIRNHTSITCLWFPTNGVISDNGIENLINMTILNINTLGDSYDVCITNNGIKNMSNLTHLELLCATIDNDSIQNPEKLTYLHICINRSPIFNGRFIKQMINLTHLYAPYSINISDDILLNLRNLEYLHMNSRVVQVSDISIEKLTKLTYLSYHNDTNLTDRSISKLTKLEKLVLSSNSNITDTSIILLKNLKHLNLRSSHISSDSIKTLTMLNYLTLGGIDNVADDGIKNLINLKELNIIFNNTITPRGLELLINLEILSIRDNENHIDTQCINNLKKLTELYLKQNRIINIKKIENLERFHFIISEGCEYKTYPYTTYEF